MASCPTRAAASRRVTAVRPGSFTRITARSLAGSSPIAVAGMAAIGKGDLHALCVMHHVTVRENQAIGSKDKSRSSSAALTLIAGAGAACGLVHLNVYDRWVDALDCPRDCARVGVEQQIVSSGGRTRNRRGLANFVMP